MPVIFQGSTSSTVNLVANTALYLAEGNAITTSDADGISSFSDNLQLFLDGDVISLWTPGGGASGAAVDLSGDDVQVQIGANASILAAGDFAVGVPGTTALDLNGLSTVQNFGTISSVEDAVGFGSSSDGSVLTNHGTISTTGSGDAVQLFVSDNVEITNHGLITGGGINAINSDNLSVVNFGTIESTTRGTAIASGTGLGLSVINHGTILGASTAVSSGGGADLVENYGTMNSIAVGSGNDTVINAGLVTGDVNLGNDADLFDGRGGTVTGEVAGGGGDDTYIIDDASIALSEGAGQGTDEVQSLVSFTLGENFEILTLLGTGDISGFGNEDNNTLTGNNGDNVLGGLGGDDILYGLHGDDLLSGGNSNDELFGGSGRDTLDGGNGNDTLAGQGGDDWLLGRTGNDLLNGSDGDDTLAGGLGDDTLNGGDGTDILIGGGGQDFMRGNDGSDVFRFLAAQDSSDAAPDRILDFVHNEDFIDLRALIDGALPMAIGGAASGTGPSAWTQEVGANTVVRVDVDGDGLADMRFDLIGTLGVSESDFML